jgi:hypothetical protein
VQTPRPDLISNGIFQFSRERPGNAAPSPTFVTNLKDVPEAAPAEIEGYGLNGDVTTNEDAMVAMRRTTDATRFFVRFSTSGNDRGKLLDPVGMHFSTSDFKAGKKSRGVLRYDFREVSAEAFIPYLSYLKSRKQALLLQAERIILNG